MGTSIWDPACIRDPACNRDPASISTICLDPRPVSGTRRLSGTRLLSGDLRYLYIPLLQNADFFSICLRKKLWKSVGIYKSYKWGQSGPYWDIVYYCYFRFAHVTENFVVKQLQTNANVVLWHLLFYCIFRISICQNCRMKKSGGCYLLCVFTFLQYNVKCLHHICQDTCLHEKHCYLY